MHQVEQSDLIERRRAMRRRMHFLRSSLLPSSKEYADAIIAAKIEEYIKKFSPPTLALYVPLMGEPQLLFFARKWMEHYKCQVTLPVVSVQAEDKILTFHQWYPGMKLVRGMWGLEQPAEVGEALFPYMIVLPLLAFNSDCYRLGYGGGYYDATLSAYERDKILTVGVAYSLQEVDDFQPLSWDQPLDAIVTDSRSFYSKPIGETNLSI